MALFSFLWTTCSRFYIYVFAFYDIKKEMKVLNWRSQKYHHQTSKLNLEAILS